MYIPPKLALFAAQHGKTILKWALAIGLFIAYSFAVYHWGKANERAEYARKETKEAIQAVKDLKKEISDRTPVVEKAAQKRAKLEQNIDKGREAYEKAIDKAGVKPECDLTEEELQSLKQIVNASTSS